MSAVTAILSCIIKILGLFKSTKWRHFENVKFEALSAWGGSLHNQWPPRLCWQMWLNTQSSGFVDTDIVIHTNYAKRRTDLTISCLGIGFSLVLFTFE